MKQSSKNHQISVNESLKLIQVSSTPAQCVKIFQQDCTRDCRLVLIRRGSRLDIIDLTTLRRRSCLSSMYKDQNVKSECESFFHLENRKKVTVFMWTVIAITVRQCSKQFEVTTTSVPVEKLVPH